MVAVAVEEHAGAVSAQGVALAVAFLCLEEVAVKGFGSHEGELWLVLAVAVLGEIAVAHDLVKEVPLSLVGERAHTLGKDVPEGVEHVAGSGHILNVALSAHRLSTSLVHGVVVKVAHEDDAYVLAVNVHQRVDGAAAHVARSLTLGARRLLSAQARGPVVDHHRHGVAGKDAHHANLVAGAEVVVPFIVQHAGRVGGCGSTRKVLLAKALVGNVEHAEVARVVHHAHVHATTVGTLVIIGYLQAPVFNQWVARNIFKHCLILYLAHANDGRAIGGVRGLHLREGIGHVVNL